MEVCHQHQQHKDAQDSAVVGRIKPSVSAIGCHEPLITSLQANVNLQHRNMQHPTAGDASHLPSELCSNATLVCSVR